MSDFKNKNFTAADIERYHKGLLSPSERHALEKAALDDPFLADALEGYAVTENVSGDLAELENRLHKRTGDAKVVPIEKGKRDIPWLRVAVMIVLLVGGVILASQFLFNKKQNDLAQVEKKQTESAAPVTSDTIQPGSSTTSTTLQTDSAVNQTQEKSPSESSIATVKTDQKIAEDAGSIEPVTTAPVDAGKTGEIQTRDEKTARKDADAELARNEQGKGVVTNNQKETDYTEKRNAPDPRAAKQKSVVAPSRAAEKYPENAYQLNTFRGKVTDNNNRGLPFANVTNTRDNVGTYTDVAGNFVLTSPDTTLDVQVKSLGYDNNYLKLRNSVPNNTVMMQPDQDVVSETIMSRSNSNAMRRQATDNMKVEEPEPADGWENYDVYLANNLNLPLDFKPKVNDRQEVELSFEVDKNGAPVNIRIERSLCSSCDQEAIRLVKEGPKWKRKAKKRTRVTVAF